MEIFIFIVAYILTIYFFGLIRVEMAILFAPSSVLILGVMYYRRFMSDGTLTIDYYFAFYPFLVAIEFAIALYIIFLSSCIRDRIRKKAG